MALSWEPDPGSLQQIMILLKESQSSDTKTQQDLKPVSLASTQTRHRTCAYTDCDYVVLETGGSELIPRLQQLSRICLHKGTPLGSIVMWIVWRCMCVCVGEDRR